MQADPGPAHLDPDTPGRFIWENNSTVPISADGLRAYARTHPRIFFIYGPLGQNHAMDAEAASLEAVLTADGYRLVDRVEGVGFSVKTEVLLYAVAP